jgi:hypothetical protein
MKRRDFLLSSAAFAFTSAVSQKNADAKGISASEAEAYFAEGVSGVVVLNYHLKGGYTPYKQTIQFFSKVDGNIRLSHTSRLTTSRRGAFGEMNGEVFPFMRGGKKLFGFPLFPLEGVQEFKAKDWSFLHDRVNDGNDVRGKGSDACFRVLDGFSTLKKRMQNAQKVGTVMWVILHHN